MATIRSSLSMYDGMTGPLQSIHKALNIVLNSFEAVQNASGNVIDTSAIQDARDELARAERQLDDMEQNIRDAENAQDQFNGSVRDGANAADALGNKLKGILATVVSIAGIKSALGWVKENLELANVQRNSENQLKAVLANMGVEDIEIPVTTNAEDAISSLNACADAVNTLDGSAVDGSVSLDAETALNTLNGYADTLAGVDGSTAKTFVGLDAANAWDGVNAYSDRLDTLNGRTAENTLSLASRDAINALKDYAGIAGRLDGSAVNTTLKMDTGDTLTNAKTFEDWKNRINGGTIENTLTMNGFDLPATPFVREMSTALTLDTGAATTALNRFVKAANGANVTLDTTKAASGYADLVNSLNGNEFENTLMLNTAEAVENYEALVENIQSNEFESTLTLNTADGQDAFNNFVNTTDGNTITTNVTVDTTQTMSAFDAIAAKASEIQGRGIYGDEAMIAGAAEFATYFTDAEAIMSMMDTLANYSMGMSGGGALDKTAIVDYATNLGKIMTGAYDAMTKKGFEFTDAQKAIIEGTATEAQIVEALGAEYLTASDDMKAAAAINSVIAESWDGLYEAMSNTPEGKIIQFQNSLGDLREVLGNQLYPAVLTFYGVFQDRFPQIERILTGFASACSVLITVLTWIAEAALNVATVFVDNWSWISPILFGIAAAYMAIHGAMIAYNTIQAISTALANAHAFAESVKAAHTAMATGATFAQTVAQNGLNAALMACPIMWVVIGLIAIVAAIYAAVGAVNHFAGTSISATGIIGGAFAVLGAHVINTFIVPFWNALAAIANFIGNVFNDPVAAVKVLFYDMALTVVGYIKNMAEAIEAVINKIPGVTVDITSGLDRFYSGIEKAQQSVKDESGWVEYVKKMDFIDYGDAATAGYNFGEGVEDKVSGLFKMPTLDEMGLDSVDAFNLGNNLDGIYGNTGDTASNTAKAADKLDYMDEDLAWMRDIAEREAINRYTTAQITVEQHNENHISKDTDLDGIMDAWAADFAERLDISAEGVHE